MKEKKFLGKIRQDPWESLAKGPKEVMASLWQEYLQEVLNASQKSRRFQEGRRQIEGKSCFPAILPAWNTVAPLGPGERVTPGEGKPEPLREERLKPREVPGPRQCCFYLAATRSC